MQKGAVVLKLFSRKRIFFVLILSMIIVQACSKNGEIDKNTASLDLPSEIQVVKVINEESGVVTEHRDLGGIEAIVAGLEEAELSYIGDPEQSGILYKLELVGSDRSLMLSLNDLRQTNGSAPSGKVYAEGTNESGAQAWALTSELIQRILQGDRDDSEPELTVTIDEDSDTVLLIGNRDMDRESVELAIQSTIYDASSLGTLDYRYGVEWTDNRRAVVRFTELPPESAVGFMLEGTMTSEGKPVKAVLPYEGRAVIVHAGKAWSGIRWTNIQGNLVKEHAFDSAVYVGTSCCPGKDGIINMYDRDGKVDRLDPETGEVSRLDLEEWPELTVSRSSDSGVQDLYAFPAQGETYYIAKGLEFVYLVDPAADSKKRIYQSEEASIYGIASSPDGDKVAVLTDSEGFLGSYADLWIFDATGKRLAHHEKAAYIGHSDGWHFVYPMVWQDSDTVAVPLIGRSDLVMGRGKAIYDVKKGLLAEEASVTMPEVAIEILKGAIPGWSGERMEIIRALPMPQTGEESDRYFAAHIAGQGTFLIDLREKQASRAGAGALLGWTSDGSLLTWYSAEGKYPEVSLLD
ncbi:hypothetical protein B1748_32140 [Paenibacillus sp. MY03]|nr:hypothetical protein B1748_32140 [Paenibacillus sp. MY03]